MVTTNHYSGPSVTFTEAFAASGGTVTLPAPGVGLAWIIDSVGLKSTGAAVTTWAVDVQENGGTSIYNVGAVAAAPAQIYGPISTKGNDAPKVVLTTAGATATVVNVIAHLASSGA